MKMRGPLQARIARLAVVLNSDYARGPALFPFLDDSFYLDDCYQSLICFTDSTKLLVSPMLIFRLPSSGNVPISFFLNKNKPMCA